MFAWSMTAGAWFWIQRFNLNSSFVVFSSEDFNVFYAFEDCAVVQAISESLKTRLESLVFHRHQIMMLKHCVVLGTRGIGQSVESCRCTPLQTCAFGG
jgi:hypothetical protein